MFSPHRSNSKVALVVPFFGPRQPSLSNVCQWASGTWAFIVKSFQVISIYSSHGWSIPPARYQEGRKLEFVGNDERALSSSPAVSRVKGIVDHCAYGILLDGRTGELSELFVIILLPRCTSGSWVGSA